MSSSDRAGFTLFEVLISLMIVAVAVLSVAPLFPMGIRAQQMARYQLYASAKAIELSEVISANWTVDLHKGEGSRLNDGQIWGKGTYQPDIERLMCNWGTGVYPLPPELARRLQSDGDEIQAILDEGGMLYYASPKPSDMLYTSQNSSSDVNLAQEAQRMVFAVVGYAQNNALLSHPMVITPEWDWYPSPPRSNWPAGKPQDWERAALSAAGATTTQIDDVFAAPTDVLKTAQLCMAVMPALPQPATQVMPGGAAGFVDPPAYQFDSKTWTGTLPDRARLPGQVIALRYHAHAAMLLAKSDASKIPAARLDHERMLRYARYWSANFPYDWRAPRQADSITISDFPLLEWDLFDSSGYPSTGVVDSRFTPAWRCHRLLYPTELPSRPEALRSLTYANNDPLLAGDPTVRRIDDSWGVSGHYSLSRPFAAAERCRQLVFWAVDWQAYEDFESLPSATMDASRMHWQPLPNPKDPIDDPEGQGATAVSYAYNRYAGNPEWQFRFQDAARTVVYDGVSCGVEEDGDGPLSNDLFYGRYGVDRNGNGKYDRGTIAPSVRLKAVTIGRFNLYDPVAANRLR